ncbi:aminotransferase class V-fold PLP-dependent enzyme [Haloimpatiens lingqiaonensis]|uniref:aminotransferase class V-fold PLP-dependent enzyme n=1 Tax=Haloimpatiens lingqiaonensis TaxID=1380675 RepID=UPI0010FF0EF1|nr:aminotransferase class V-fold PLP-dependent enzyme [Haloimpatiens lingqiaonensis]
MNNLYLDNAATSFPKPKPVADSIYNYILNIGCNVNRGAYSSAYTAENTLFETRELLCNLFNFSIEENVIFTKNITESLNILIKGFIKSGDHIIVSSMEHNAVMRPITSLSKLGVSFSRVPCDNESNLRLDEIENLIKPNTKAIVMTHASNVCGTILPLEIVGDICKKHNLFFIIDSAQTAGFIDVDFEKFNADAIAFTGHKSLMGPQGIGGFLISDRLNCITTPLIEGGTGSLSESESQPDYMPDKFESGTMNLPGIFGLNAALKYINNVGLSSIREKELELTKKFIEEIKNIKEINLIGKQNIEGRTAVVSLDFTSFDNGEISHLLNRDFNIMTRCGLHCAPSAHKTLGTFPRGTVRFSFSHFNTLEEVKYAVNSINDLVKRQ